MTHPIPARRSPTGFVAQRLFPDGGMVGADGVRRPWLLTKFSIETNLQVEALTDGEVASWPEVLDTLTAKPGDRVLVSFTRGDITPAEADQMRLHLEAACPDVTFVFVAGQVKRARDLGPGTGDEEVWLPPPTDCMQFRVDKPCPHCGSDAYHHRTRRCGACGRRAEPAN